MIDRNFIGNSAAFSAAALFGASVVATRAAVGTIPPLSLAFLRFGQGGLILLIFLNIRVPGSRHFTMGSLLSSLCGYSNRGQVFD